MLIRFLKDTKGATSIEYSLLAAMAGIVVVIGITSLGAETFSLYGTVAEEATSAMQDNQ